MSEKTTESVETIYNTTTQGRLRVSDSDRFIKLLSGIDEGGQEAFAKLYDYSEKQMANWASDIPRADRETLIHMAITKGRNGFDPEAGANFLTYLGNKFRAEIKGYRERRDAMQRKVYKALDNPEDGREFVVVANGGVNEVEVVETETEEVKLIAGDLYRRQMVALKGAYSSLPAETQTILEHSSTSGTTYKDIAWMLHGKRLEGLSGVEQELEEAEFIKEIKRKRNSGLTLVFVKTVRSPHLTKEEKIEFLEGHGIDYTTLNIFESGEEEIKKAS